MFLQSPSLKIPFLESKENRRLQTEMAAKCGRSFMTESELKQLKRTASKVDEDQELDCRKLLGLLGVPFVMAPSDARAQCAELVNCSIAF
jgi:flap endonuclease-1